MFAMVFERDPMQLQDVPGLFFTWIQAVGGWTTFGICLWLVFGYSRWSELDRARIVPWKRTLFLAGMAIAAVGYIIAAIAFSVSLAADNPIPALKARWVGMTIGALGAFLSAGVPFVLSLASLRWRRIWALARLSFKEAIRRRVLYGFSFILLIFLFASWFLPHKPEDQVRSYVGVVYWTMSILLLLASIVLASFSIPTDIKQQTIHTIVTKPVERFEIILGRFLGFTALMTLVLLLMTTVSVIYVLRGVDKEAADESLKAREPLYGVLRFENTGNEASGINVGREWNYRSYITTGNVNIATPYAIWDFPSVPRSLAERKTVRCEFAFDIYRTTKGFENRGISCEFEFLTANFAPTQKEKYNDERNRMLAEVNRASDADIDDKLAEQFGYYVVPAKDITDYHTLYMDVPAGLFRNAVKGSPSGAPPVQVRVSVTKQSASQYVGMAKYDLYWRLDDPNRGGEKMAFTYNFYKGAFGIWMRLCLVIGVAVILSTFLSGVISMILAGILYLCGGFIQYIASIGMGTAPGGGPMEALVRLTNREIALIPLEDSAPAKVAVNTDEGFRFFIRRLLDLIPDVDRYDLTAYVSDGFNIPITEILLNVGALALYLLPGMVLAYYLLRSREIAAPT
jgi:ABC-type transport system involved in multi-copper enzyme maturation permease subunit